MSTEKRAAVYGVFTAVLAALTVFGFTTAEEQAAYTAAGGEALSTLAMLMAAVKTWRQRGEEALVTIRMDGTNAEKAQALTELLQRLRSGS